MRPVIIKKIINECIDLDRNSENQIYVAYSETDISTIDVLFIGPKDSPYAGGFFYFKVAFPKEFPFRPPHLTFLTPKYAPGCRLHPNLYDSGKVCLSILNTWGSNEWSPALTLEKIFITIQALLDNDPNVHEPGCEKSTFQTPQGKNYYMVVLFRTLQTAVIDMLNRTDVPDKFHSIMKKYFLEHYAEYLTQIDKLQEVDMTNVRCFHGQEDISCEHLRSQFKNQVKQLTGSDASSVPELSLGSSP